MSEWLYEGYLNVEEPECFCGRVDVIVIDHGSDSWWIKYILGEHVDVTKYTSIGLHIGDEDDFGGATFYIVPKERYSEVCDILVNHAINLKKKYIGNCEFFEERISHPSIDGIKNYWNW